MKMHPRAIKFGQKMLKAIEEARVREDRTFSNLVKHSVLFYLQEKYPELVKDIKIDE